MVELAILDLVRAATASAGPGGLAAAPGSPAGRELQAEQSIFTGRSQWNAPVQDTHTLGAVALLAATDHLRGFATLVGRHESPGYAHQVLARSGLEACVVAAWLNEPVIEVHERVKRGLAERMYSARQQQHAAATRRGGEELEGRLRSVAASLAWPVSNGGSSDDPVVGGACRPDAATEVSGVLAGEPGADLGQAMWAHLSGLPSSAWYSLAAPGIEPPREDAAVVLPPGAVAGASTRSVGLLAICLIRLYLRAAEARLDLMGRRTAAWEGPSSEARRIDRQLLDLVAAKD